MLNQYHPRAPLKSIFVQNDPKPYCHFVILSRLVVFPLIGLAEEKIVNERVKAASKWVESRIYSNYPEREQFRQRVIMLSKLCNEKVKAMQWEGQSYAMSVSKTIFDGESLMFKLPINIIV